MKPILRPLGSPAMIVACAALIVALGGVSYAAGVLPKGSVGTAQLKKQAVTASKLRANSVSGLKVKDGTLAATDFKAGQLPAGPQGPKGDTGAPGISGLQVVSNESASSSEAKGITVTCPEGKQVVGTGADISGGFGEVVIDQIIPTGTTVNVQGFEKAGGSALNWSIVAIAICANVS